MLKIPLPAHAEQKVCETIRSVKKQSLLKMNTTLNKDDQAVIDHVKYIRIDINMWPYNENESYVEYQNNPISAASLKKFFSK